MIQKLPDPFYFIRTECILIASSILLMAGCTSHSSQNKNSLFKKLSSSLKGLSFSNTITETDSMNLITNEYAYMGAVLVLVILIMTVSRTFSFPGTRLVVGFISMRTKIISKIFHNLSVS